MSNYAYVFGQIFHSKTQVNDDIESDSNQPLELVILFHWHCTINFMVRDLYSDTIHLNHSSYLAMQISWWLHCVFANVPHLHESHEVSMFSIWFVFYSAMAHIKDRYCSLPLAINYIKNGRLRSMFHQTIFILSRKCFVQEDKPHMIFKTIEIYR